jgi:hypothetical protein
MFLPKWAHPGHPVFRIEARRQTRNRGLRTMQRVVVPVLFGVTGLAIPIVMVLALPMTYSLSDLLSTVQTILAFVIGVLVCIQLAAGAIANILTVTVAAPLISGEIELQSWRLLRTTLVTLPEIVFAKLAAVLYEMRTLLGGLLILRLVSAGTIMLFFLPLIRQMIYYMGVADLQVFLREGVWLAYAILMLAIALYDVSQPIIQAALSGALGMAASAFARSRSQAIAGGLVARLVCWIGSTLLHVGLMYGLGYLMNSWASPSSAPIDVFRSLPTPTDNQIVWALCLVPSGYLLCTGLAQIGLTFTLMGATLRRARRLEV